MAIEALIQYLNKLFGYWIVIDPIKVDNILLRL
jgi:hypothetical protein